MGPNNSGKSLLLREVEAYAQRSSQSERKILEGFDPQLPDAEEARQLLISRERKGEDSYSGPVPQGYTRVYRMDFVYDQSRGRKGYTVRDIDLVDTVQKLSEFQADPRAIESDNSISAAVFNNFVSLFTIRLDGSTRLALTEPHLGGDLADQAQNHLQALVKDESARSRLREITRDAFELNFLIDPTAMQVLRIKMSDTAPSPGVELHLGPESREFFEQATDIAELMGADPSSSNYLKPEEGDVWAFMRKVGQWIGNPGRKGMPE